VYIYYSPIVALSPARFVGGALVNDLHIQDKKNYRHCHSRHILNDLGWEIYPEGLYHLIMHIKNQWNKPVFITENGVADKSDEYRAPFIVAHLQQIKRAIDEGADAVGYLHWSLMDNYEWHEGYTPEAKFGLFRIDRGGNDGQQQQPDFTRHITKGAEAFKIIIEECCNQSKSGVISNSAILKAKEKFGIVMADGSNITY
jgi:beta-glucosidase/6-phospho-beta-glucosidase/beta-galactosidase